MVSPVVQWGDAMPLAVNSHTETSPPSTLGINLKFTSLVKQQPQSLVTVNSASPPLKIAACFSDEKLCCAGISIVSHGGGLAAVLNICHIRLKSHRG